MENNYDHGKEIGELIQAVRTNTEANNRLLAMFEGQEKRLRALENWRWWLAGSILVGMIGPQAVKAFM